MTDEELLIVLRKHFADIVLGALANGSVVHVGREAGSPAYMWPVHPCRVIKAPVVADDDGRRMCKTCRNAWVRAVR